MRITALPRTRYYIADAEKSLDWLLTQRSDADGPLSLRELASGIGAITMGSTACEEAGRNGEFPVARFSAVQGA
jgi:hypothetical protein